MVKVGSITDDESFVKVCDQDYILETSTVFLPLERS